MLGGGDGVGGGRIDHEAPVLRGGRDVHVVDPHAGAAHDLEPPAGRLEDLAGDPGAAPDDEGVAEGDLGAQLLRAQVVGAVDVGEGPEEVEARIAELLGDEDGGLRAQERAHREGRGAAGGGGGGVTAAGEADVGFGGEGAGPREGAPLLGGMGEHGTPRRCSRHLAQCTAARSSGYLGSGEGNGGSCLRLFFFFFWTVSSAEGNVSCWRWCRVDNPIPAYPVFLYLAKA